MVSCHRRDERRTRESFMAGKKQTAVVGCGWFGRAHVRNFVGLSDLVAVCDSDKNLAGNVAKQNNARAYTSIDDMLKEESIDALSVVTPPQVIASIGLSAVRKGVNVLLEKPCGVKLSDLTPLAEYQDSVRIMPGFLELFNPVMDELRSRIGEIGDIMTVDSTRIGLFPKRNWGVGVMTDLGVHDVYLHRELARVVSDDTTVVEVSSVLKYMSPDVTHEDAIFVLLKFHKFVTCIHANWITPSKYRCLKVTGTDATLEADFMAGTLKKLWGENLREPVAKTYEQVATPLIRDEPLRREIDCFLNSEKPPVSLQDAHDVLKITLQALHQI